PHPPSPHLPYNDALPICTPPRKLASYAMKSNRRLPSLLKTLTSGGPPASVPVAIQPALTTSVNICLAFRPLLAVIINVKVPLTVDRKSTRLNSSHVSISY